MTPWHHRARPASVHGHGGRYRGGVAPDDPGETPRDAGPRRWTEASPDAASDADDHDRGDADPGDGDPGDVDAEQGAHTALPPKLEGWRRRSATGAILTGFAFGLQQALEPERKEPAIVMETSGNPPRDLPVDADVEYARPRRSVINIRPWLLGERAPSAGPEASGPDRPASAGGQADPSESDLSGRPDEPGRR